MASAEIDVEEAKSPAPAKVGFADIAKHFVLMGWTAFGGPAAHVGLFQLLSGILFQYPGAIMMTVFGLTAHNWATPQVISDYTWLAGLVGGLSAAGVALVASAAIGLWNKACGSADAKVLAGFCCIVLLYYSAELIAPVERNGRSWMWIFPTLIIFGGAFTYLWRGPLPESKTSAVPTAEESGVEHFGLGPIGGAMLIVLVALVFVASYVLPSVLEESDFKRLFWFSAFWRTGTVIWGGGQVVLPLLENEMVPTGWVDQSVFFAGLALAQAMPGPLFNFAAFLGAAAGYKAYMTVGEGVLGAVLCWLGLFGPGVMLIFGILPFWGQFRSNDTYKRALPGLNAAAVGLLCAALVQMGAGVRENNTKPNGPIPKEASTCIGLIAFWGVHWLKFADRPMLTQVQAPIVVVVCGILGLVSGVLEMR